jgi:hypothetical protein
MRRSVSWRPACPSSSRPANPVPPGRTQASPCPALARRVRSAWLSLGAAGPTRPSVDPSRPRPTTHAHECRRTGWIPPRRRSRPSRPIPPPGATPGRAHPCMRGPFIADSGDEWPSHTPMPAATGLLQLRMCSIGLMGRAGPAPVPWQHALGGHQPSHWPTNPASAPRDAAMRGPGPSRGMLRVQLMLSRARHERRGHAGIGHHYAAVGGSKLCQQ